MSMSNAINNYNNPYCYDHEIYNDDAFRMDEAVMEVVREYSYTSVNDSYE